MLGENYNKVKSYVRSIVITRLFTFFHPLRLAFKSLSIHQLNDSSTPGVPFPDKAPKRRLKIKKKNMCVTNATGGLLVYQVLHSGVKCKHNFDTKG